MNGLYDIRLCEYNTVYTVSQKMSHFVTVHIFDKY